MGENDKGESLVGEKSHKSIFHFLNPLGLHLNTSKQLPESGGEGEEDKKWDDEGSKINQDSPGDDQDELKSLGFRLSNIPQVPDGGYGWVIVFSSFMCNFIIDGIANSFGVFLPYLIDSFKVGGGSVTWASSLLCGTYLCVGPIVSALTNKYGCRVVCMSGSILGATGLALSALSNSLYILFLTYGIIGGIGFGCIYLPAVVCVAYYFERKRAFATGIAVCGSGVGTMVFAPVSHLLLKAMSWQDVHLIFAAVVLLCGGFGALMRPLSVQVEIDNTQRFENDFGSGAAFHMAQPDPEGMKEQGSKITLKQEVVGEDRKKSMLISGHTLPTIISESLIIIPEQSLQDHRKDNSQEDAHPTTSRLETHHQVVTPLSRKDIFYKGSIANLREFQSQRSLNSYHQSVFIIPKESFENIPPPLLLQDTSSTTTTPLVIPPPNKCNKCAVFHCGSGSFRSFLSQMVDCSLLRNPVFLFIGISNVFAMLGFYVPIIYLTNAAINKKVDAQNAAFLISTIGIANTIGKVVTGFLSDFPSVNSLFVNNLSLTLSGVSIFCVPFCTYYYQFVLVAIFFGLFISAFVSLTSIILVELLGLDNLTNAFGLVILFQGGATIIGAPLAGMLYDTFGNYEIPFYLAGVFFMISGFVSFLIPFVKKFAPS